MAISWSSLGSAPQGIREHQDLATRAQSLPYGAQCQHLRARLLFRQRRTASCVNIFVS